MDVTVQPQSNTIQYPQMVKQVKIHCVNETEGYMEAEDQVYPIQGMDLDKLERHIFPLLDGSHSVADLVEKGNGYFSESKLVSLLTVLAKNGIVKERIAPPSKPTIVVLGEGGLYDSLVEVLGKLQDRLAIAQYDSYERAMEEWSDNRQSFVVAVSDGVQDAFLYKVNDDCIQHGKAVLFAGLERDGIGFIGPYWEPGHGLSCYRCLQARINMNHPQGKIRQRFGEFVQSAASQTLSQRPDPASLQLVAAMLAMEIERISAITNPLHDHVLWVGSDGQAISTQRHRLLPVPKCAACGRNQLEETKGRSYANDLLAVVDERVGIVQRTVKIGGENNGDAKASSVNTVNYAAIVADVSLLNPSLKMRAGAGAGYNEQEALFAAVGESVERYASGLYDESGFVLASWKELDGPAMHPDMFPAFSSEQYNSERFSYQPVQEDSPVRWVQATDWRDGSKVWVPAALVYLPYSYQSGETRIIPSISTGMAAGPSLEAAILTGLYEVIERDAFSISWLYQIPPRQLSQTYIKNIDLSAYLQSSDVQYQVYDLSLDIPLPSIFVTMQTPKGNLFTMGGACRLNPAKAVEKAMLEAAQSIPYVTTLLQTVGAQWEVDEQFDRVDSFQKHAIVYSKYPELRSRAGYIVNPAEAAGLALRESNVYDESVSTGDELAAVVELLHRHGRQVLVVDVTTPDLRKVGVSVVRVIVPGFQHLMGFHRYRLLGTRRLEEISAQLGLQPQSFNPFPHPFP